MRGRHARIFSFEVAFDGSITIVLFTHACRTFPVAVVMLMDVSFRLSRPPSMNRMSPDGSASSVSPQRSSVPRSAVVLVHRKSRRGDKVRNHATKSTVTVSHRYIAYQRMLPLNQTFPGPLLMTCLTADKISAQPCCATLIAEHCNALAFSLC